MHVHARTPLPGPVLSATTPLTQEQVVVLLEEALGWDDFEEAEEQAAAVQVYVSRFEATWGPLTLATLLRVAHHFAPEQVAERREPATAATPPDMPLLVERVGADTFVVAEDTPVALVGLGLALQQGQHQQGQRRRGQLHQPPQHQQHQQYQQREPQEQGQGPFGGWRTEAAAVLAAYLDSPRQRSARRA